MTEETTFKPIGEAASAFLLSLRAKMDAQRGKHAWEPPVRPDVNNTFRTCRKCGMVKITRHEPANFPPHWVEFERDGLKVVGTKTPACVEAPQQHLEAAE